MNSRIRTNTESRVLSRLSPRLPMPAVARPRSPPRRRQGKLRARFCSSTSHTGCTDSMAHGLLKSTARVGVKDLIDHVSGALTVVLFFVTLIGILAAPLLILLFAPGFSKDPTKFALASDMLRITFPYLLFISLTAFAGGILNAYGRFAVPAFTPTFLNLAMIGAALWVAPHHGRPIPALAWGVFLAGVLQLLFQWPYLVKLGLLPRFRFKRAHEGVSRI